MRVSAGLVACFAALSALSGASHAIGDPAAEATAADPERRSASVPVKEIGRDVHGQPVMLPLLGAGTWQYNDTVAYQSVCKAFQAGYSFVDTAFGYRNQKGVGMAIRDCWQGTREDLFVMTKVPGGLTADQTHAAHVQNLQDLGLDYVDHLMVHYPADWKQTVASKEARQEEWLALEDIYSTGEARSIGVSHYCVRHLMDIMEIATVKPAVNQNEYHVGSMDVDHVTSACQHYGITFMSFSPLCGPCTYDPKDSLINGDLVSRIAQAHGVTGSQVSLRYIVQQGIPAIPKSNTMAHVRSNMDIFNFQLTADEMWDLMQADKPAAEAGDCDVP